VRHKKIIQTPDALHAGPLARRLRILPGLIVTGLDEPLGRDWTWIWSGILLFWIILWLPGPLKR
jgi:hypothetical protein